MRLRPASRESDIRSVATMRITYCGGCAIAETGLRAMRLMARAARRVMADPHAVAGGGRAGLDLHKRKASVGFDWQIGLQAIVVAQELRTCQEAAVAASAGYWRKCAGSAPFYTQR